MTAALTTTPTTALLSANPPSMGGPFASYTFTATPVGGGAPVTVTCLTMKNCPMPGLTPGAVYDVTVAATTAAGTTTPPSAPMQMAMPPPPAPALVSADATGPTQGFATANAPTSGGPWSNYTFTAIPVGGGAPVVVTSATPYATFNSLQPRTQYTVSVVANGLKGATTASNTLPLETPALRYAIKLDVHVCAHSAGG